MAEAFSRDTRVSATVAASAAQHGVAAAADAAHAIGIAAFGKALAPRPLGEPKVFGNKRMVFESVRFIPTSLARATSTERTR